ncbi:hypothetical protein HELRODRAFT_175239 [Helobdella robusta]|uniref:Integrin alpha-2 domain-containing protein n=1 Tax=Helobdella robusta TaxID=6412 RepID=T1F920_HELRO|nr:hypothetical protein HELRODRAFT_175239 [Helobdella robusta]ESO00761.1 hypothetical protein HELRODRAFT_175239 [Helobdella robusta]
MNNRTKTLILGAPRSMDHGQVMLIQRDSLDGAYKGKKQNLLTGRQLGAGFGHAVVVIDLNSDGLNDIVVSAPFEYGQYYGGAVYVYHNSYKGINSLTKPKKIISQKVTKNDCLLTNCIHSRFGSSIANIGDIDSDGFPGT